MFARRLVKVSQLIVKNKFTNVGQNVLKEAEMWLTVTHNE